MSDTRLYKDNVLKTLMLLGVKIDGANLSINELKTDDVKKFVKPSLQLKHNKSGVKYTVDSVDMSNAEDPVMHVYRYDDDGEKIVNLEITKKEFKDYSEV
jgi:hypothetical protein